MNIGIDLIKIKRVEKMVDNKTAVNKIFNTSEITDNIESLAGKLAIKEAYFKAIGEKIDWLDLEIKKEESGQPVLYLKGKKQTNISVSISHDGDYAVGVVLLN
jgi:phosphopantetheine--protein transferase-like protein